MEGGWGWGWGAGGGGGRLVIFGSFLLILCYIVHCNEQALYKSPIIVLRFTLVCWPNLMATLSRFCEVNVYVLVEFCDCNTVA